MRVLKARIYEMEIMAQKEERDANRKNQVGSGDRSDKIRTYNFPQSRVTDHRIGLTVHNLPAVLDGDIQTFFDALIADEQTRLLEASSEEDFMVGKS
jgi:peptide chain release factor 1